MTQRARKRGGGRSILAGAVIGAVCAFGILLLGVRILGLLSSPRPARPLRAPELPDAALPLSGVVVILDPGHGGQDPGADHGPQPEAMLTYRTATEFAAALHDAGAKVVYTVRSRALAPELAQIEPPLTLPTDAVLAATGKPLLSRHGPQALWDRAAVARAVWVRTRRDKAAARNVFFLSLHYDQFGESQVSGAIVCVDRRVRRIPALAIALAREMSADRFGRGSDFRGVSGISGHTLGVLDPAYNPVPEKALLEIATLSNPQDQLEAADPVWRGEIARRITAAIVQVHQGVP